MSIEQITRKINRLRRVAQHIDRHLFEPLCLDDLAEVASMSRYHFERVFTEYAGETPLARVRRLRLQHARRQLVTGAGTRVLELALDCGYGSAEAFTRAFRSQFGCTPSSVMVEPEASAPTLTIRQLSPLAIQYIPYSGRMDDSLLPFDELRARAMNLDIPRERRKGWAVHLSGQTEHWNDTMELQAALLSDRLGTRIPGIDHGSLPGGSYAVFSITGSYDAPPAQELARRVAAETEWRIADGPILRCFDNPTYLPAQHERRYQLYLPVTR